VLPCIFVCVRALHDFLYFISPGLHCILEFSHELCVQVRGLIVPYVEFGNLEGHISISLLKRGRDVPTESLHVVLNLVFLLSAIGTRWLLENTHVNLFNHELEPDKTGLRF
jgi:hypothetical protein